MYLSEIVVNSSILSVSDYLSINPVEYCSQISKNLTEICSKFTGIFCPLIPENTTYYLNAGYTFNAFNGEITNIVRTDPFQCRNQTVIQLCRDGHYCSNASSIELCPVGSYCSLGAQYPKLCSWSTLSCPYSGMSTPSFVAMFFLFLFVLIVFMFLFYYLQKRSYLASTEEIEFSSSNRHKYSLFTDFIKSIEESTLKAMSLGKDVSQPYSQIKERERLSLRLNDEQALVLHQSKLLLSLKLSEKDKRNLNIEISRAHLGLLERSADNTSRSVLAKSSSDDKEAGLTFYGIENYSAEEVNHFISVDEEAVLVSDQTMQRQDIHIDIASTSAEMSSNERPVFTFQRIENPLFIAFDKLHLSLKSNDSVILENIFGVIKPFSITALMGSSGAGKTTLLTLLRGQAYYAHCAGSIFVNANSVPSLSLYQKEMAFVPQDDIVYEDLTVEDNIMYSALLFNKRGFSTRQELLPMVQHIEKMLGLAQIRNSVVGGVAKKGISGGQKKRVSLAMEVTKEAALLFLDEPTSGLDSATSISVLHTLHELSGLGVSVIATLHQPRQEILDLIHTLILLAPGGRVAYFGPPSNIRDHFCSFGYICPANANIADFVMDCMAGFIFAGGDKEMKKANEIVTELCDYWEANEYAQFRSYIENEEVERVNHLRIERERWDTSAPLASSKSSTDGQQLTALAQSAAAAADAAAATAAGHSQGGNSNVGINSIVVTLHVGFSRQQKLYWSQYTNIVSTSFLLVLSGVVLGVLMGPVRLLSIRSSGGVIEHVITGQLVFGIFSSNAGLKLFGGDELMRIREESGGIRLIPLFIGKLLSSYIEFAVFAYSFLCGYYSVIQSNAYFLEYLGLYFVLHLALSGLGNIVAVIIDSKVRDLTMLGVLVVLWLFGGVQPPQPKLGSVFPVVGPIINALSPFKWSFELQTLIELRGYSSVYQRLISAIFDHFGYVESRAGLCAGALVAYWAIANTLAILILLIKRENYMGTKRLYQQLRDALL